MSIITLTVEDEKTQRRRFSGPLNLIHFKMTETVTPVVLVIEPVNLLVH